MGGGFGIGERSQRTHGSKVAIVVGNSDYTSSKFDVAGIYPAINNIDLSHSVLLPMTIKTK
jgi:hypothetical protein